MHSFSKFQARFSCMLLFFILILIIKNTDYALLFICGNAVGSGGSVMVVVEQWSWRWWWWNGINIAVICKHTSALTLLVPRLS